MCSGIDSKWMGFFGGLWGGLLRLLWNALQWGGVQMGSVVRGCAGFSVEYRPHGFWKRMRKTSYLESRLGHVTLVC
jgi:hypothetical protein